MRSLNVIGQYYPFIFYAESRHYFCYFEQLLKEILAKDDLPVLYITSDRSDPLLSLPTKGLETVYIKNTIQFVFPKLRAGVMFLTMTDLGNFGYKRSPHVKEYRYVFHAAVSIHQQYTEKAFFNYDSFYALHRQHTAEINALQVQYGLPEKTIIPYGYPLLHTIQAQFEKEEETKSILVAPSWFQGCILDTCIEALLDELSATVYNIIIRPHPEYVKRRPNAYKRLKEKCKNAGNIFFAEETGLIQQIAQAHLLITDRSGIALEYAFGTFRPVLFIDTPSKIMNPNYARLGLDPIEDVLRSQIGIAISPQHIAAVHDAIIQLKEQSVKYQRELRRLKAELFYARGS